MDLLVNKAFSLRLEHLP